MNIVKLQLFILLLQYWMLLQHLCFISYWLS